MELWLYLLFPLNIVSAWLTSIKILGQSALSADKALGRLTMSWSYIKDVIYIASIMQASYESK